MANLPQACVTFAIFAILLLRLLVFWLPQTISIPDERYPETCHAH